MSYLRVVPQNALLFKKVKHTKPVSAVANKAYSIISTFDTDLKTVLNLETTWFSNNDTRTKTTATDNKATAKVNHRMNDNGFRFIFSHNRIIREGKEILPMNMLLA